MENSDKFEKTYIGKGTQVEGFDIIKVNIKLSDAIKSFFIKKGEIHLSFEVARMKQPDKNGNTHTAYFSKKEAPE